MTTTSTTKITRRTAERVLAAIIAQHGWLKHDENATRPVIVENWAWSGDPVPFAIVWEEGPCEWAYLFPYGGIDAEFGWNVRSVESRMPKGVFAEAMTSWAIGIFPI